MKILFNPSVNYSSPIKKHKISNDANQQKTNTVSHLNCITNYNLAFCGKEKAIYAIDLNGNLQKFNSALDAAQVLGLSYQTISSALKNKKQAGQKYIFLKAQDIEKRDKNGELIRNKDGKIALEQRKIKKAKETFLYSKTNYPIIEITPNGKVTIYQDIKEASLKTNISPSNICCAVSRGGCCNGSLYMRLSDFVLKDKNGNVIYRNNGEYKLDEEKIELYKLVIASK